MKKVVFLTLILLIALTPSAFSQRDRGAYFHALSDLRAARWMLQHHPGNWVVVNEEMAAIRKIDDAIEEIKRASFDDGRRIDDHPPIQEIGDHRGRLGKAIEYLQMARADIAYGENNDFARRLRQKAFFHIDEAIRLTQNARMNMR